MIDFYRLRACGCSALGHKKTQAQVLLEFTLQGAPVEGGGSMPLAPMLLIMLIGVAIQGRLFAYHFHSVFYVAGLMAGWVWILSGYFW